jgi:hypothetical protein
MIFNRIYKIIMRNRNKAISRYTIVTKDLAKTVVVVKMLKVT